MSNPDVTHSAMIIKILNPQTLSFFDLKSDFWRKAHH